MVPCGNQSYIWPFGPVKSIMTTFCSQIASQGLYTRLCTFPINNQRRISGTTFPTATIFPLFPIFPKQKLIIIKVFHPEIADLSITYSHNSLTIFSKYIIAKCDRI